MITYTFLQQYWWFIVSLLGALLVFLLFVQGANSLIFSLGKTAEEKRMGESGNSPLLRSLLSVAHSLPASHCFIVPALVVPIGCG